MDILELVDVENAVIISVGKKYDGQVVTKMFISSDDPVVNILTEKDAFEYKINNGMAFKLSNGSFVQAQVKPTN
jgi:hypothetical protein